MSQSARDVDVVIACHNPERPLARAVASVLEGNGEAASVTVVAHGVEPSVLKALLPAAHAKRVRFLHLVDSLRSASGPFNLGMDEAPGAWVSIMGSDDTLMPGAVASWRELARRHDAEAVLTRLSLGTPRALVPTPPVRPVGPALRDLARDRLAYRSAPLGLMSTAMLRRLNLRLDPGFPVGGDVEFTTRMLAQARVAVDTRGPSYVIGEDAGDRVTYVVRPMDVQLAFVSPTLNADWFRALPHASRLAIAVKYLRIHVFGAIHYRPEAEHWLDGDRQILADLTRALVDAADGTADVLSLAEFSLLEACLDPAIEAAELAQRSRVRRAHGRPRTLLTRRASALLHREAPLRFMGASAISRASGLWAPPGRGAR